MLRLSPKREVFKNPRPRRGHGLSCPPHWWNAPLAFSFTTEFSPPVRACGRRDPPPSPISLARKEKGASQSSGLPLLPVFLLGKTDVRTAASIQPLKRDLGRFFEKSAPEVGEGVKWASNRRTGGSKLIWGEFGREGLALWGAFHQFRGNTVQLMNQKFVALFTRYWATPQPHLCLGSPFSFLAKNQSLEKQNLKNF